MKKLIFLSVVFFFVQNIFSQTPGTKKWELQTIINRGSPAIGSDGAVYAFTDTATLAAINPDGSKKWDWTCRLGVTETSVPAIGPDGTIYICSFDGRLYAINPDGTKKWEFQADGTIPALSSDGTIYISSWNGLLFAINPDGTKKWEFQAENNVGPAAIATDGTIYFGSGQNFFALNPDGTKKWTYQARSVIKALPVIGDDGIIYVCSASGLFALNPDGTCKWKSQTGSDINSSLAISSNGTIFGVTDGYRLYAMDPDGNEKWSFQVDSSYSGYYSSTPAIGSNGTIYVGLGNKLCAINSNGTKKWDFQSSSSISASPAIASDGTVYFSFSWENTFYAVYSESSGLADSPWPKYRKNNQNQASTYNENCPLAKVVENHISLKNGGEITLDASPSYDPDGDALSYLWRVVEMPQNNPLVLTDSTSATITVDIPSGQFAEYRFSLKVTDNEDGASWTPLFVTTGKKWELKTGSGVYSSPAISQNGTVYIISDKLYAINDEGTIKWEYEVSGRHLAISSDGTIYVGSWDNRLYAFNSDGTKKWEFETNNRPGPPAIGSDGTIYFSSRDDGLFALNPDGTKLWEFEIISSVGPPVVGTDGKVYFYYNGKLFALNPDGKKVWTVDVDYSPDSPAIGADGIIYVNSQRTLYAIRPDGTTKWTVQKGEHYTSSPSIGVDGTIYVGSDKLYAVNPDGSIKWDFAAGGIFNSTPAIGSDGTIYAGSGDSSFYAINPDGTEKWSLKTQGRVNSSPALDSDGVVYFGSNDSTLYALYTESSGLADSPWPKYRKNNQNTAGSYNANCPQAKVADDFISMQFGGQVTLDGSPSYDPDGEGLSYLWRIAEKPQGSTVVLGDSTSAVITVDIPQDVHETYRFALTVTDNDDGYSSASVTVSTALKWEFDLGSYGSDVSSPAIASDSTVYIGTDNTLYAVNPDGAEKWQFSSSEEAYGTSSPAIAADGTVYIGIDKKLFAVNPDGTKKWDFETKGSVSASPAIASDGTIFVISKYYDFVGYGTLYAINPDGTKKWEISIGILSNSSTPTIGSDGTIYIGSYYFNGWVYISRNLLAINSDGSKKWSIQLGAGNVSSSLAIGANGTIYLSSDTLFAVNPDGTIKWECDVGSEYGNPLVVGSDGTIYVGSDDSLFYAINSNGTVKWTIQDGGSFWSSPAIGSDGTIFIYSRSGYEENGKFYAINADGTKKWKLPIRDSSYPSSSPAFDSDGTVYIGSNDGKLSAIYSDCGGLANSSWPKFNKDNQNTANGFNPNCPIAKVAEKFISIKDGGYATLDGSHSYDPDGDALSYLWRIIEKPRGSAFTLNDSTSAIINIKINEGSRVSYRFSLTVTDNDDGVSSTLLTVSSEIKWVLDIDGSNGSPAISTDGTLYYSSGKKIYAVNPNGTIKWEFIGNDNCNNWTSPAIASDGTIFNINYYSYFWWPRDFTIYAINSDGSVKWTAFSDSSGRVTSPAIDRDGTIYIGYNYKLFAINPDSTKKWEFDPQTGSIIYWAPAISSDGTIYICSGSKLFAVNTNGIKQWEYEAPDYISFSPIIASDGTIYISSQNKLLAISSSGTKKWESDKGYYNPVIGKDNTIYLGASNRLVAIKPDDGTKKWEFVTGDGICSPAIGKDGSIFFGSSSKFYALNPEGSEKWCFETDGYGFSSPAIDPFGTIYFGSGSQLYALYSECGGLANSPWPKYRHDNRNTGNVDTPTPIEENKPEIPTKYALFPMYPNPFNPLTHVKFSLPKLGRVQINVYNILGQKVAKLLDAKKTAGTYEITWDASNFASGMYFIYFESWEFVKVRKCLLIK